MAGGEGSAVAVEAGDVPHVCLRRSPEIAARPLRIRLPDSAAAARPCLYRTVRRRRAPALAAAEQRQDDLRRLVGDRQRLRPELLLHLQGLKPGALLGQIGVDEVADP